MTTCMPFVKLESGRYLIGTHERKLQMKGKNILLRTGGGHMYFLEYIKHYSRSECIALSNLVRKCEGAGTVQNAVIKLLYKLRADKNSVANYEKNCSLEMSDRFEQMMKEVKQLEQTMKKQD